MKAIIIEDKAYLVTNRVLKELQERQELINVKNYHTSRMNEMDLQFYIENHIDDWNCLGYIHFDFRL